jgi:hypothetical protein
MRQTTWPSDEVELIAERDHGERFGPEMDLTEMLLMAGLRIAEGATVLGCEWCDSTPNRTGVMAGRTLSDELV